MFGGGRVPWHLKHFVMLESCMSVCQNRESKRLQHGTWNSR